MKIGIDLGGSHIALGIVDEENKIISKKEHNWTKEEKDNLFENAENYSKKLIKELLEENEDLKIENIGIGYPYKNIINGIVYKNGEEFNLPEILFKEFGIQTYLKNDVKCSAICEKTIGNLKDYNNCIFMTLGTGIGGAYFYKNELVTPNKYQGFEIGHMIIQTNGRKCRCGSCGCFEEYGAMRIFRGKIEELFNVPKITSHDMFRILENKEKSEEVNKIIDEYTTYLSVGISNLINIFEPDAICIGGSFTYYAPIFMDKLKEKTKNILKDRDMPDIVTAKYENDAGIIGASMLKSN